MEKPKLVGAVYATRIRSFAATVEKWGASQLHVNILDAMLCKDRKAVKKSTNKSKWKQCKSKLNTMEYLRCLLYLGVCTKGYLTGNILHNGVTTDRFISCICYLFKVTPESTTEKVKV